MNSIRTGARHPRLRQAPGRRFARAAVVRTVGLWIGASALLLPLGNARAQAAEPGTQTPQLLFVQMSEDLQVDTAKQKLRLVNVNQQTIFFADRPDRIAGHMKMDDYLETWKQGKDNFGEDPPNASLSVYEPGQAENTIVIVELLNPVVDGADLVYDYKLIEGTMPTKGGATSLFIDTIGVGGGVGPGYHGVGVGRRGPGVR